MNKKYWQKWYENKHYNKPTLFVKFAKKYIPKGAFVCELGCGNGRDSYYLGKIGNVIAYDFACENRCTNNVTFIKKDWDTIRTVFPTQDVTYSRFFLHCLTNEQIKELLVWAKGTVMFEFRAKGDEPVLWTNHERNFIDGEWLLKQMLKIGYKIIYYKKGFNMAKFKRENPLVIRVVARRK